jgi:hypothetical protein
MFFLLLVIALSIGAVIASYSYPLNVYTVQNPRRRVVLKKNQPNAYNMYTHIGKILSACLYLSVSFSLGGGHGTFL